MDQLTERKIESKEIFKGRVVHLTLDTVELPNGHRSTREVVRHPGAVAVIARNEDGKVLLVRQYRYALDKILYEIPAGKLEPGEDPDAAARRELEEETGYRCGEIRRIASFYSSPGFSDERLTLYFTDDLLGGRQHLDDDEFLEVYAVDVDEAVDMAADGRIQDAKSNYAVQYLQLLARG